MTPATTALILVDVINDFYSPKGPNYYDRAPQTLEPIDRLLSAARGHGAMVVHAVERHRRRVADAEQPKLPPHCYEGSFEADFFPGFGPVERPGEVVVPKRRFSAFFATDLALTLHENDIARVVVVGVKTNVCIRATVQDAFANGFEPVLPRDATNSNRPHLEEASLEDIDRYFGTVCSAGHALDVLTGGAG